MDWRGWREDRGCRSWRGEEGSFVVLLDCRSWIVEEGSFVVLLGCRSWIGEWGSFVVLLDCFLISDGIVFHLHIYSEL